MLQRVRRHADFHLPARRASTLVAAVCAPEESLTARATALIAACARAEVAASGVNGDSPWAVLSVRERADGGIVVGDDGSAIARDLIGVVARRGVGRVVLLGEPAETLVLHTALALLRPGLDVGVAWDASDFSDDFARDLTVRRACQAGVIPYTSAALAAELDLNLDAGRPRAAVLGKEIP